MRSFTLILTCFLFLIFTSLSGIAQTNYYQVIAYFHSGVQRNISASDTSATVTSQNIQAILDRYQITNSMVYPAFPSFSETDTLMVTASKLGIRDSIKQMNKSKVFTITVHDTTMRNNLIIDLSSLNEVLFVEMNGESSSTVEPNDPGFSNQWGLKNTSNPNHDIHATYAWDIFTGNPNSIIAIIDEGVDINHQDLSSKIVGGDNSYSTSGSGSFIISHGTLVAGVAAATSDNGIGISGVDWNAKLLPKDKHDYWNCVCTNFFTKPHGWVLINQKINEAVNFSPNVWTLNNSWNLDPSDTYSAVVREAFAYAYKNNRISVVATGNSGLYKPVNYPVSFNTGIIAVGQSDNQDYNAPSNFGPYLDVVAPGQNIYSTNFNDGYISDHGTSLAAPFVSGLASLLKGFNTNLNNDDIEEIIKLSADDITITGVGWDNITGYGRINAEKALQFLQTPYQLQQLTTDGGTIYATSTNTKFIMLGVLNLADASYFGKRIEVRTTVNLPANFCSLLGVWGDRNQNYWLQK